MLRTSSTWKVRSGKSGSRAAAASRALYVTALGQRVVIVRVFVKKTEKIPRHEIELGLGRAREVR